VDKMVLDIFQREVEKQCEFALNSVMFINDALSNLENRHGTTEQLWYYVQNFLVASANVSKLLWGSKEKISESRKELRESLKVSDDSILKNRIFRNHFEHIDERIEAWASSTERRNFVDSNVGPANMIIGIDAGDYLRNFNTDSMAITFKGDTYEIKPIFDELLILHENVKVQTSIPHW
jgi:hypothetical protein